MSDQADFLLRNFPVLARTVRERRADLLERARQGAAVEAGRGYDHTDPTGKRGAALGDLAVLEADVGITRGFINTLRRGTERRLLLQVWRFRDAGWDVVARTMAWEVAECKKTWKRMTERLARKLKNLPT